MSLKIKHIFALVVFAGIFSACKKDHWNDLFKPTGKDEMRIREVSGFNKIKVYDKIDVYVTQGPAYQVKVEAGSNMHIGIVTDVDWDSTLIIKNENKCNFVRDQSKKIKIYVTAPHFYYFTNKGVGTIYCSNVLNEDTVQCYLESSGDIHLNINAYTLKTASHGNGDVYVEGYSFQSFNYLNGTNTLDMRNCTVQDYMYVTTHSVCHIHVKAPEGHLFEGDISSDGNVYYTGNPSAINFKHSGGKGEVIKE
jgi:hypothetical protein